MSNNKIKISIITATYNSEKTINDCLNSIATQEYNNYEHIIIDGGSDDSTCKICMEKSTPSTKIISEKDSGMYYALNKGLKIATGEIICLLHSDDIFINRNVLEKISRYFLDPSVSAVYSDLYYVSKKNPDKIVRKWISSPYYQGALKYGWMPPHPTLFIRQSHYNELGGFNTDFRISSDYDFIIRLFKIKNINIVYIPEALVNMRTGGASNGNIKSIFKKTLEDYKIVKLNNIGGIGTIFFKNISKIGQLKSLLLSLIKN